MVGIKCNGVLKMRVYCRLMHWQFKALPANVYTSKNSLLIEFHVFCALIDL